ncbi:MAG: ATP synthase F1 subunit delta [Elusimicrobiales bacterium]|nr:ATP synthase F1 subunit delta [Elusimicrobiales bacterium]
MDSGAKILAKRYARAYMALDAKAHGAELETEAGRKLESLRRLFEAARPHMKALTHPAVNSEVRQLVLAKILGAGNTGPAAAFADLLVRKGRFGLLDDIMQECLRINDNFCGVVRAEVYSRFPLSEGEVKRIQKMIGCVTGKKVNLRQVLAERVVGGFEIKIGDTLIDATVRGRLDAMRAGLLKG